MRRGKIKKRKVSKLKRLLNIIALIFAYIILFICYIFEGLKNIIKHIWKFIIPILILIILSIQLVFQLNYNNLKSEVTDLRNEVNEYQSKSIETDNKIEQSLNDINNKIDTISKEKEEVKQESTEKKVSSRGITETREIKQEPSTTFTARMTSYYTGDGCETGTVTGSGKTTADFQVNEKGWYTYKGKLVLAGATNALLKSGYSKNNANVRQEGKYYFNYYDEVIITINGVDYEGIVLDSCGAAMWEGKTIIDLFVSRASSAVTTSVTIKVK